MPSTDRPTRTKLSLVARSIEATSRAWAVGKARDDQVLLVDTNPAFQELTGFTQDRLASKPFEIFYGLRTDTVAAEEIRQCVRAGRGATSTVLLYKRDGTTFWADVALSPITDDDGIARHYVIVLVDVTGHVLAQRDLEAVYESERSARAREELTSSRIQALLTQMPSAVFVVGASSGRILATNEQTSRLLGRNVVDNVKLLDDLCAIPMFKPDGLPIGKNDWALMRTLHTGEIVIDEEVMIVVNGKPRVFLMRSAPVFDEGQAEVSAAILLFDDITERRRAAQQLEQSQKRAAALAHSLQQSLLPAALPTPEHLDFASAFVPLGEGLEVGGDFYDVFEQRDGDYVAVIGDVMGKGVEAAAVTSLARHVLRTTALRSRKVSTLLQMLNEALCLQGDDHPFATVAATMFVRDDNGTVQMTVGLAGHPSPLVISGGEIREVGKPGTLSGVVEDAPVFEEVVALHSGDIVVLYTDGVTEARDPAGEFLNTDGLRSVLQKLSVNPKTTAQEVVEAVERAVVDHSAAPLRDDLAVLVVRIR